MGATLHAIIPPELTMLARAEALAEADRIEGATDRMTPGDHRLVRGLRDGSIRVRTPTYDVARLNDLRKIARGQWREFRACLDLVKNEMAAARMDPPSDTVKRSVANAKAQAVWSIRVYIATRRQIARHEAALCLSTQTEE